MALKHFSYKGLNFTLNLSISGLEKKKKMYSAVFETVPFDPTNRIFNIALQENKDNLESTF